MNLGLALFLIGLAIFLGAFAGMLLMGMFCSNLRAERDAWRDKYDRVQSKYKLLLDDLKRQMGK